MMYGKSLLSSKTVWFNVIVLVVALAELFGYAEFTPSDEWSQAIGAIVVLVNLILRVFATRQPITSVK